MQDTDLNENISAQDEESNSWPIFYLFVCLLINYPLKPLPLTRFFKGPGFTAVGVGAACQSQFKVHEISMSIDCSRGERGRYGGGEGVRRVLVTPLIDRVSYFEFLSSLGPLSCQQFDMCETEGAGVTFKSQVKFLKNICQRYSESQTDMSFQHNVLDPEHVLAHYEVKVELKRD